MVSVFQGEIRIKTMAKKEKTALFVEMNCLVHFYMLIRSYVRFCTVCTHFRRIRIYCSRDSVDETEVSKLETVSVLNLKEIKNVFNLLMYSFLANAFPFFGVHVVFFFLSF